jgi:hypothetical protein
MAVVVGGTYIAKSTQRRRHPRRINDLREFSKESVRHFQAREACKCFTSAIGVVFYI